jgi:hypothetical protein
VAGLANLPSTVSGIKARMANQRRFELDELTIRPGTYFNPQTEVLIVVDDSAGVDHEIFDAEEPEEAEWVLISDESPLDEHRRDELLERFQVAHGSDHVDDAEDEPDDEDELEPDEDELE